MEILERDEIILMYFLTKAADKSGYLVRISSTLIMKQDLLVCFHCYGVWRAKTPLKVCDTSVSMTSFYKLTFFGFDGFTSSSPAIRDMVTEDSG